MPFEGVKGENGHLLYVDEAKMKDLTFPAEIPEGTAYGSEDPISLPASLGQALGDTTRDKRVKGQSSNDAT